MTKDGRRAGTLDSGDHAADALRLFLALPLPDETASELGRWRDSNLLATASGRGGIRAVEGFHITLAFLGSTPRHALDGIVRALRDSVAESAAFDLVPRRYRETRTVGMLVLDDPSGEAARLAGRLHDRLEALGVYRREARPWLPHTTLVRFRERPRLSPPAPPPGAFAPSEAAAFLSRLHPSGARYEILERCRVGNEVRRLGR